MRAASFVQKALSLGLALAIALPPSAVALADDTSKVALAPIVPLFNGVPQATADRLTEMLARELRKQDGLELVPLAGAPALAAPPPAAEPTPEPTRAPGPSHVVTPPPASTPAPNPNNTADDDDDKGGGDSAGDAVGPFTGAGERALTKGEAQVAKGKKDMQRLKLDAAVTDLQDGIAGIEGSFDLLSDYGVLVEGYLQLAIAELRLGQRDSAEQALSTVIRLAPEHNLTGSYPAVFTRLYSSLKTKLTQGPKGPLAATSTPAGQTVRVDGRDSGATPVSLDLIPGVHFVVIAGDGGKVAYKVQVQEGATVQIGSGDAPGHRAVKVATVTQVTPPPPVKAPPKSNDPLALLIAEITQNNIDDKGARALGKLSNASGSKAILFGGIHYLDDEQTTLALDTMLYSQSTQEVAALTRVQFDADLTSAPVELFKVAAEVAQHLAHWSDVVGLPQPVAPGLKPPKAGGKPLAGAHEARRDDDELVAANHTRKVDAQDGTDLGPPAGDNQVQKSGGGFPWLGVGIGVGAAVVVAVAVIVIVSVASQKAGSNPTVSW